MGSCLMIYRIHVYANESFHPIFFILLQEERRLLYFLQKEKQDENIVMDHAGLLRSRVRKQQTNCFDMKTLSYLVG